MAKYYFTLLMFTVSLQTAYTQVNDSSALSVKLSIAELTSLSMPNVSVGFEKNISRSTSLELGGGYVYYSIDELITASGYSVYGKYNYYYKHAKKRANKLGVGFGVFYTKAQLDGNLLYKNDNYFYYKETPFSKERVGIQMEHKVNINLKHNFYLEINAGIGFTHFSTYYEDKNVVQDDFRNGFVYGEVLNIPVPIVQIKIGWTIK